MKKKALGLAVLAVATVSTGCSLFKTEVPKCSDTATLDLVRQIIAENVGADSLGKIPIELLRTALVIELPHAISLEENIKKYSCEATLLFKIHNGNEYKLPIEYTTQLDDNDQHLVNAGGFTHADQLYVGSALAAAVKQNEAQEEPVEVPSVVDETALDPAMAAAYAADAAMAADAAQIAEVNEEVSNTPEQVAENAATRERIFSGTGEYGTPKFTDFPVAEIYSGPTAKLDNSSEEARTFKTRISTALAGDPVNFAGEYTSAGWGCGTMCGYTTFVSKRTGQLIKSGLGGELGPRVVNFMPNSEMVIAEGGEVDDEYNSTGNYAFFYRLQDEELVLIKTVPVPEEIY